MLSVISWVMPQNVPFFGHSPFTYIQKHPLFCLHIFLLSVRWQLLFLIWGEVRPENTPEQLKRHVVRKCSDAGATVKRWKIPLLELAAVVKRPTHEGSGTVNFKENKILKRYQVSRCLFSGDNYDVCTFFRLVETSTILRKQYCRCLYRTEEGVDTELSP